MFLTCFEVYQLKQRHTLYFSAKNLDTLEYFILLTSIIFHYWGGHIWHAQRSFWCQDQTKELTYAKYTFYHTSHFHSIWNHGIKLVLKAIVTRRQEMSQDVRHMLSMSKAQVQSPVQYAHWLMHHQYQTQAEGRLIKEDIEAPDLALIFKSFTILSVTARYHRLKWYKHLTTKDISSLFCARRTTHLSAPLFTQNSLSDITESHAKLLKPK